MDFQSDERPSYADDMCRGLPHSVSAQSIRRRGHHIEGPSQTFAVQVAVSCVFLSLQYTYHPTLMSMSEFQNESIKA